ncbi:phosphopantothenoylcysteine decarboxylase / phosphopantothenate--cysteine ligase [Fibrisoma limi BUZ 3]|uniref:Phosphopantothenoylcysteine decarboxylase / phosphopantothenate--cysteine ligase n=2 Tax=Fibrisoma limi TaxID=663275 RepID=I2GGB0_9BACT|nr:phosphopantothenoylcysteine decarboxylase / phosphopantothenate--cysteine ligase [Fibrisoma limi BUZ 3]
MAGAVRHQSGESPPGRCLHEPARSYPILAPDAAGEESLTARITAQLEIIMNSLFSPINRDLSGLHVLVTAGPTHEAIDPVRYIGNHSTGKMGYAVADVLAERGATVTLVSGPTNLTAQHHAITVIRVRSAAEMYEACLDYFPTASITVLAAAVADYTPKVVANRKIKKQETAFMLELVRTVDIAASLGQQKSDDQFMVGFALETDNELANAQAKLVSKNLDLIVLNSLRDEGAAFGHDTNQITILHRDGGIHRFGLKAKREVARDIVDEIIVALNTAHLN